MYTIIIADDEQEQREAIINRIQWNEIGFSVLGEAENGIEALEMVEKHKPDLLLTDIRMPFISGIELARKIREVRPATQIAFLSGYDDFQYAQQAIQYNIISYLLKPISAAELTEELYKIKNKIDQIFEDFSKIQKAEENSHSDFFLPLLLNKVHFESPDQRELRLKKSCTDNHLWAPGREEWQYVVLSSILLSHDGQNCTNANHVYGINKILRKYAEHVSFYIDGRIVSIIYASPGSIRKYLHILADDIVQSLERILMLRCCIGIGNQTDKLIGLYDSCEESGKALAYWSETDRRIFYISDVKAAEGTPDICEKALAKIDKEYVDPDISLVSVSSGLGISPNYLSTLIKKKTGISFIDYLTRQRMKAAEKMLRETDMKIREISEECGYNDQHYFSYCFKKYAGVSPNTLRRQLQRG